VGYFKIGGREQGLDGDKTTTNAICFSSLPQAHLEDGRGALRLGDKTSPCGLCGQIGEIVEGENSFKWDGIPTALHNAMVMCGCPPGTNRLIAPSRTKSGSNRDEASTPPKANIGSSNVVPYPLAKGIQPVGKTWARSFFVTHSETGQPLANRKYIATVDGQQRNGATDSNGIAYIEGASANSSISIHIPFHSPARELIELAGMTTREVVTTTRVEQVLHGETPRPIAITVNDRAATREAIIQKVRELGHGFVERSGWHAKPPGKPLERDWDYSMIALHHAGRSYSCNAGGEQMQDIQSFQQNKEFDDIGYHFGIDCSGIIYEGRDIRSKGGHLLAYNSNVLGIVLLNNLTTPEEGKDFVTLARTALDYLGLSTTNPLPSLQVNATINLITVLKDIYDIEHFGGHREFPHQDEGEAKICPGNVGMNLVKKIRAKTRLRKPMKS
jgi:uncharacterized Zn-binding protein involved in type VI secretion